MRPAYSPGPAPRSARLSAGPCPARAPFLGALPAILLLLALGAPAAAGWESACRLQTSFGDDNNVREALAENERLSDSYFRMLGEAELSRDDLMGRARAGIAARGFREDYRELPEERRRQAELRGAFALPLGSRGADLRFESGWSTRVYPAIADSLSRDFDRVWGSIAADTPFGPRGTLHTSLRSFALDFEQTGFRDQWGTGLDISYEQPVARYLSARLGLELTGTRHGRDSIQWDGPPGERSLVVGPPRQRDSVRHLHLGLRWVHGLVARVQYGFRAQNSNSLGSSLHRHEVRWLLAASLPQRLTVQCYGNLEATDYTDPNLDDVYIFRGGEEVEARDDNNQVILGVSRPLRRGFRIEARHGWYENESLLIGSYYRKSVWTVGLGWEQGHPSVF